MPSFFPTPRRARACQRTLSLIMLPALLAAAHMSAAAPKRSSVLPKNLAISSALGVMNEMQTVNLTLGLPARNEQGLDDLIHRLYDPKDPLYGKYLKPADFAARFSPSIQDYDALASYYEARGFQVTGRYADRLLLNISAPASVVTSTFGVKLGYYQEPNGRVFYSADREPQIPAPDGVAVSTIFGLDNAFAVRNFHSAVNPVNNFMASPFQIGGGPLGGLSPTDIKSAYSLNSTSQTGTGQTLALVELDGYQATDIGVYEDTFGLPHVPLQNVPVDGATGAPNSLNGEDEVTLDIELQIALAPNASQILVYRGLPSVTSLANVYAAIANDNLAPSVSCSWGTNENPSFSDFFNQERVVFKQMATQGQSFFAASGDSGAYANGSTLSVSDPASQPEVIGVGGTTLFLSGGAYAGEKSWGSPSTPSGGGGGGGISALWPKQPYQAGFGVSNTARNVPDVSLASNPDTGYSIYTRGGWTIYGGTSCAAPLWSAFAALVNQKRAADGRGTLGFANTVLYPIAATNKYTTVFHDIHDGSTNLYYPATVGYDDSTGLGSFIGDKLLLALAPPRIPVPPTPTNFAATAGAGQVSLSWNAAATATSYTIKRATINGGAYSPISTISGTSTINSGIANGVTYYYVIAANNTSGQSDDSAQVSATPQAAVGVSLIGVSLAPATVVAGSQTTGTVTLSAPAPAGGVSLRIGTSSTAIASVPAYVTIPANATSANFTIGTGIRFTAASATITGILNGVNQTATLNVTPASAITNFSVAPASVIAGAPATGAVTISQSAPAGGTAIRLTSSDTTSASVPTYVTVPAGATSATFPVTTTYRFSGTSVTITGLLSGVTQTTTLGITAAPAVTNMTIAPATVASGTNAVGTVTISLPAPAGGTSVNLSSGAPAAVSVPAIVLVPAGATSVDFTVTTHSGYSVQNGVITATVSGTSQSATITTTVAVVLTDLSISPATIASGGSATGTVTLSTAPTGDTWITLASSDTYGAPVYAGVTVRAGVTSATFPINTRAGLTARTATITATYGSVRKTATLSITAH